MSVVILSDEQVFSVLRTLSARRADLFQIESLIPQLAQAMKAPCNNLADARDALADPYLAFRAMIGHYAFAKRGKDRHEYAALAMEALDDPMPNANEFSELLAGGHAGDRLWQSFAAVCARQNRKVNEQLNRGVFEGLGDFATEIYQSDGIGNIWTTLHESIVRRGRAEPVYHQIVNIRGIGPKVGSLLLRDMVAIYQMEDRIEPIDYHYLQPVDAWTRKAGPILSSEICEGAADWIVAGKLAKLCRRNRVSGVRFSQGMQYLAVSEVQNIHLLPAHLERLAT